MGILDVMHDGKLEISYRSKDLRFYTDEDGNVVYDINRANVEGYPGPVKNENGAK